MTDAQRLILVEKLLCELAKRKTRATYVVVACLLDIQPRLVAKYLGEPRPEASWVVRKVDGKPTRYRESDCDPRLYCNPHVITSCGQLRQCLGLPPVSEHQLGCEGGAGS